MSILVVTGTGTEVGKTIATASIASLALSKGLRVAVVKPAQTGVSEDEPGDVHEVSRLAGVVTCLELARYPDPLAPRTAARMVGQSPPDFSLLLDSIAEVNQSHDLVLLEGAGGLLVQFDEEGHTIADIAIALEQRELATQTLIVATAGLGTLNTTTLTAEALRNRKLECTGVIIGSWPHNPGLAEICNLRDLPVAAKAPLLGVLPEGMADDQSKFADLANLFITPTLGGKFDVINFIEQVERR